MIIALSPCGYGQNSDESSVAEKKTGRLVWIVATGLPDGIKSPVSVLAGGELFETRLSKRSVGKPVKIPADRRIQLVQTVLSDDGKPSYTPIASALIPEGINKALVILSPAADLKPPLKFLSRVIDLVKFRGGSALFVNNTKLEIAVTLGTNKTFLRTGEIKLVDMGKFSGSRAVAISYHYRLPKQKQWKLISASTVPLRSSLREILVFSYNADTGAADYHGITFAMPQ